MLVVQEESELEAVMKAADLDGDGTLNYEVKSLPGPCPVSPLHPRPGWTQQHQPICG